MLLNLEKIFYRLKQANLKINPKKCVFFNKKINYLDHIISAEGIATDPEKISTVKDWPIPQSKKYLRSFLGFYSYYRKFVKGFSSLAKSLFVLTENQTKFVWEKKHQSSFNDLKRALTSPILAFPGTKGERGIYSRYRRVEWENWRGPITKARRYRKSDYIFQSNIK